MNGEMLMDKTVTTLEILLDKMRQSLCEPVAPEQHKFAIEYICSEIDLLKDRLAKLEVKNARY